MPRVPERSTIAATVITTGVVATIDLRAAAVSGLLTWLLTQFMGRAAPTIRIRMLAPSDGGATLSESLARAGTLQLVEIEGPLVFTSVPQLDRIISDRPPWQSYLIVDLRDVTTVDSSALSALLHVCDCLAVRGGSVLFLSAPRTPVFRALEQAGLASRALGGTLCFTLCQALERIAACHAEAPRALAEPFRPQGRTLHLVR